MILDIFKVELNRKYGEKISAELFSHNKLIGRDD